MIINKTHLHVSTLSPVCFVLVTESSLATMKTNQLEAQLLFPVTSTSWRGAACVGPSWSFQSFTPEPGASLSDSLDTDLFLQLEEYTQFVSLDFRGNTYSRAITATVSNPTGSFLLLRRGGALHAGGEVVLVHPTAASCGPLVPPPAMRPGAQSRMPSILATQASLHPLEIGH